METPPALALAQLLGEYEERNDGYYVLCPCHDDTTPSLCITNKNGINVWICRAGCDQATVTKILKPLDDSLKSDNGAAPTQVKSRIIAEYNYHDEESKLLYQVVRYEPKAFRQRKPDSTARGGWAWKLGIVRKVLFQLPEISKQPSIVVVEGEKDALALAELGIPATTCPGGAGKWRKTYSESLRDKKIAIIGDRDAPGRKHAQDIATHLHGIASSVRIIEPPFPHKDVSDWIENGNAKNATIISAIKAQAEWEPGPVLQSAIIHDSNGTGAPHDAAEWPHGLEMGEKGPRALIANAIHALESHPSLKGIVALDTFTNKTVIQHETPWGSPSGRQWSDKDDTRFCQWLQQRDIRVGSGVAGEAVTAVSQDQGFDSLQDYLRSLKWDGKPRVGYIAEMFRAKSDLAVTLVTRWLVSAVARAMAPGCQVDYVLVLEGAQGIGKSTALRVLFDPHDKGWFRDDLPPLSKKDAQEFLRGTWCVEIAELAAANARNADLDHVKAFFSRRVDSYRPSYGHRVQEFPRRCVFAGSTNDSAYLKDTTGNRRWWPLDCEGIIDIQALVAQVPQIWAEAVRLYDSGHEWWLDVNKPANADLKEQQEMRRIVHPWEDKIEEFLKGRSLVTVNDVLHHLGVDIAKAQRGDTLTAVNIIKSYGWVMKRFRGGTSRYKVYVSDPQMTQSEAEKNALI